VQVHPQVLSGGQPADEAAFAELSRRGIKTVISVDGARPQVEAAARHGLRYVHLPHGYDGISAERLRTLARALRDLEGPFYIHCHHGKHRSPAAAAAACVAAGWTSPEAAPAVLALAGTSPHYLGLWVAARGARRLEPAELDGVQDAFPEVVEGTPMVEAMVALDEAHEHARRLAAEHRENLSAASAAEAAHAALLLGEHFAELLRLDEVQRQPAEFRVLLRESQKAVGVWETALRGTPAGSAPPAAAGRAAATIAESCTACHRQFRDVPRPPRE
jgi:protein tyrosine phosphatase (PTP) superfamily phosphohydrolase (DUF442 family)